MNTKSAGRRVSVFGGSALWSTTVGFWFFPSASVIPIWLRECWQFDLRLGQWMMAQEISILQALAVDGKCLRGSGRTGAYVMATLRNLLLGLFELQKHQGKTKARTFPGWRRRLSATQKLQLITRKI